MAWTRLKPKITRLPPPQMHTRAHLGVPHHYAHACSMHTCTDVSSHTRAPSPRHLARLRSADGTGGAGAGLSHHTPLLPPCPGASGIAPAPAAWPRALHRGRARPLSSSSTAGQADGPTQPPPEGGQPTGDCSGPPRHFQADLMGPEGTLVGICLSLRIKSELKEERQGRVPVLSGPGPTPSPHSTTGHFSGGDRGEGPLAARGGSTRVWPPGTILF